MLSEEELKKVEKINLDIAIETSPNLVKRLGKALEKKYPTVDVSYDLIIKTLLLAMSYTLRLVKEDLGEKGFATALELAAETFNRGVNVAEKAGQ